LLDLNYLADAFWRTTGFYSCTDYFARIINLNGNTMEELLKRITFNPNQCGGKPCIRGMRIRVVDVLQLLANGLTFDQILEELPDLEKDDVKACVLFALKRIDHIVLAA
jgi:uncharacterized protein (DUF433 family)